MKTQSAIAILSLLLISSTCLDPRPDFNDVYTKTRDLSLPTPNLTYDLTEFVDNFQKKHFMYPSIDLQEMFDCHSIFPEGHSVSFMNLLSRMNDYSGAEIKFIFSEPTCKSWKEFLYDSYDENLCERNIIKNAPIVPKKHIVEFSAKTIKTSVSDLIIKWYKQYELTGTTILTIDFEGNTSFIPSLKTKGTNGTTIGGRPNNQGGYDYIPNTTGSLTTGTYEQGPIVSLVEVPPVLTQNVCYDGEISPAMSWDIPVEIMLIPE